MYILLYTPRLVISALLEVFLTEVRVFSEVPREEEKKRDGTAENTQRGF